ncbi:iron-containing alcohol dehydrogenase [uncultured Pseudodesulfovibrio sp.]|uniref:iron-containing alcohol dehydrogenase n=1 Tax=uncultured Pseudodesulfovibrio sp. TaxID=2035858 RepID=UPI0029C830DE|nr:iron-containing alcohol dehydrogenase [uncultured Pseudodesulfovibrio sp.]
MQFEFATAPRIVFGPGCSKGIPELAARMGTSICLVIGGSSGRVQWAIDGLTEKGFTPHIVSISGEPDIGTISLKADAARQAGCDSVVAIGGGSVLDAGKALAALLTNHGDILDYLEVIGKGQPLTHPPVPLITVPTTSGTGSEVTSNAVLLSPSHGVKVSMRSPEMIPNIAVIDPELTKDMPPTLTAATGMDALTQLMEAFVSNKANPMTDALCREGMLRAARSLHVAYTDGLNSTAREDMALASLFSGIALSNAKLGAVHGFAAPLGGEFKTPHGAVCAALLPSVMKVNIKALRQRKADSPSLNAYAETAVILTGDMHATPEDGIKWVRELCTKMSIPTLGSMRVTQAHFSDLADKAAAASSMKGNPVLLSKDELLTILTLAL